MDPYATKPSYGQSPYACQGPYNGPNNHHFCGHGMPFPPTCARPEREPGQFLGKTEMDLRVRISELEKDLERCSGEKAEAEISVQHLAYRNALQTLNQDKPDANITVLKLKLEHEREEKTKLQAQLDMASKLILSFAALQVNASAQVHASPSTGICNTNKATDLINLDDACDDSGTLLDELPKPGEGENSDITEPFISDSADSQYIVRFKRKVTKDADNASSSRPLVANDEGSSNSDVSFPSGPVSTSSSFDTTNNAVQTDFVSEACQNDEIHMPLATQKWNKVRVAHSSFQELQSKPPWKVSQVFSTQSQHEKAIKEHKWSVGNQEMLFPDIFKYGLYFKPDSEERDFYRTVQIVNLPKDLRIGHLMEQVRGGLVVDAKLLDTQKITGGKSALVTFLHEHAAIGFRDHCNQHPITFSNQSAHVQLVSTPTWPMPGNISTAIHEYRHTRCLELRNLPPTISQDILRNDLCFCWSMKANGLTYVNKHSDGVLELHFSSVRNAGQGYGILTSYRAYRPCKVSFVADPCDQEPKKPSVTELAAPMPSTVVEKTDHESNLLATFLQSDWMTSKVNPCNMPDTAIKPEYPLQKAGDRIARIAELEGFNKAHFDSPWDRLQSRLNISHFCISS